MASIFGRLGFDSTNPVAESIVKPLDANVIAQMAMIPPWLNSWQTKDVAEANTSGYFINPVINITQNIYNAANTMVDMANGSPINGTTITITNLLANTKNNAIILSYSNTATQDVSECDNFIYITNRLSNVVGMGSDVTTPHYDIAIGYGKMMNYITNQSDGIQNNAPMIGGFTSVYAANILSTLVANTSNLLIILQNSITTTSYVISGNTYYDYNSTISLTDAQKLDNSMSQMLSTMVRCRVSDTNFFQNSGSVFNDYNKVAIFNGMGQTENQLIQIIGSPKLLSRLNANT